MTTPDRPHFIEAAPGTLDALREALERCDRHDVDLLSIMAVVVSRYGAERVEYTVDDYVRRVALGLPQGMVAALPAPPAVSDVHDAWLPLSEESHDDHRR